MPTTIRLVMKFFDKLGPIYYAITITITKALICLIYIADGASQRSKRGIISSGLSTC